MVLTNAARMAPLDYRDTYMGSVGGILDGFPAVPPLYWNLALNQVARAHSQEMATTCGLRHDSCDGTLWYNRVWAAYGGGAIGENIVSPIGDPITMINALLCDSTGASCCPDFGYWPPPNQNIRCDIHRVNIMGGGFRELGVGYYSYWTQDFGGLVPAETPPIVAAVHLFLTGGTTSFMTNYYDAVSGAPQQLLLVLEGEQFAMSLHLGSAGAGSYLVERPADVQCRSYHISGVDGSGQPIRYPHAGSLRTFGEGGCTEVYLGTEPPIFADSFESGDTTAWSP